MEPLIFQTGWEIVGFLYSFNSHLLGFYYGTDTNSHTEGLMAIRMGE